MRDAIWAALVIALAVALIFSVAGGDDAATERAAKEAAEARADSAEAVSDSAAAVHEATVEALRDSAAEEARGAQAARERARLAESAAGQVASRLRAQLTREQQAQLDTLEAFHAEALREEHEVSARLERQLALARGEIAAERSFRERETERADRWHEAFDAAESEIKALRRKDVSLLGFGFDIDCGPGGGIGSNQPLKPEVQVACIVPVI